MTSKERVLQREHDRGRPVGKVQGRTDALDLASRAPSMDGTAIIAEETKIPAWSEHAVYTAKHIGYPVQDNGQVYTIQMAHTPAHNPGSRPADLRAIYFLQHTKDPHMAKPWMAPYGVSGLYEVDECCLYDGADGATHVYRNKQPNNSYPPLTPTVEHYWEDLGAAAQL